MTVGTTLGVTGASTFTGAATFNGTAVFNAGIEVGGTQSVLWVSKKGNDSKGDGTILKPYLTITAGLAAVTASLTDIAILPGTYNENISWPVRSGVRLIAMGARGAVKVTDAGAGGTAVIAIHPGTAATAWEAFIEGVEVDHNGTGLMLDNSSANGTWTFKGHNMSFVQSGGTSVNIVSGTARPLLVEFDGEYADIAGLVYSQIGHAEDRLRFSGMRLTGGLTTSTSPVLGGTAEITLACCEILHEGVGGGSANQMFNAISSWSRTGKTLAALDTNDLAGNHTENIIA